MSQVWVVQILLWLDISSITDMRLKTNLQGFSLIELILVVIIIAVMAALSPNLISLPVGSYLNLERRTALVDAGEATLSRMQRDIRRALPNSIRILGGGAVLELIHTSAGGYYRAKQASNGSGDILDFTQPDSAFDVLGDLVYPPSGELVIYNLGIAGADAYAGDNRTALNSAATVNSLTFDAKQFPFPSPQQRFFLVDGPITYRCLGTQLLRYDGYVINSTPVLSAASIQADQLSACQFTYDSGTDTRSGLVTIAITLSDASGESLSLLQQVHVDNAP